MTKKKIAKNANCLIATCGKEPWPIASEASLGRWSRDVNKSDTSPTMTRSATHARARLPMGAGASPSTRGSCISASPTEETTDSGQRAQRDRDEGNVWRELNSKALQLWRV